MPSILGRGCGVWGPGWSPATSPPHPHWSAVIGCYVIPRWQGPWGHGRPPMVWTAWDTLVPGRGCPQPGPGVQWMARVWRVPSLLWNWVWMKTLSQFNYLSPTQPEKPQSSAPMPTLHGARDERKWSSPRGKGTALKHWNQSWEGDPGPRPTWGRAGSPSREATPGPGSQVVFGWSLEGWRGRCPSFLSFFPFLSSFYFF